MAGGHGDGVHLRDHQCADHSNEIAENDNAQKLAMLAIGAGLLEMNARGFGFVNYIYY